MAGSSTEEDSWWRFNNGYSSDDNVGSRFSIFPNIRRSFLSATRSLQRTIDRFRSNGGQRDVAGDNRRSNVYVHRRVNMNNQRPRGHELWLPGNRDIEDWNRCHGMSNRDYERTKRRISQIMRFAEEDADDDIRISSTSRFTPVNLNNYFFSNHPSCFSFKIIKIISKSLDNFLNLI